MGFWVLAGLVLDLDSLAIAWICLTSSNPALSGSDEKGTKPLIRICVEFSGPKPLIRICVEPGVHLQAGAGRRIGGNNNW